MIVKIYRKKGKNKKSAGRRGLTLTRIVLRHNKNFRGTHPKGEINGKNMAKTGKDRAPPPFFVSWDCAF
jgi:hypothetical protein